jgi:hypothetical protein
MITRYNVITRDILRYSISDDQIRKVSSMMTDSGGGLAVQGSDNKYIYYFGGTSAYTSIQRFDTETFETRQLSAELPSPTLYASGFSNKVMGRQPVTKPVGRMPNSRDGGEQTKRTVNGRK